MTILVLRQGDVLVASMQAELIDKDLLQLKEELAERVGRFHFRGVVIDASTLDVMDSFATRTLRGIAETIRLRGAELVIVGFQPNIVFAMVQPGLILDGLATALDLEQGLDLLLTQIKTSARHVT